MPATFLKRVVEVPKCLEIVVVRQNAWILMCCARQHVRKGEFSLLHRFLSNPDRRQLWIQAIHIHTKMESSLTCVRSVTEATTSARELCGTPGGQQGQH